MRLQIQHSNVTDDARQIASAVSRERTSGAFGAT